DLGREPCRVRRHVGGDVTVRLCLTGTAACTGANPCPGCFQLVLQRIVPRAMARAGGPFSERDSPWPEAFLRGFIGAWQENLVDVAKAIEAALASQPSVDPESDARARAQTEALPDEGQEEQGPGYQVDADRMQDYVAMARNGGVPVEPAAS